MTITADQITPAMLDTVNDTLRSIDAGAAVELYGLSAVLRDFLNLPEVRQLVRDAEAREHAAMMAALPGWNDMSDLDKGAALMHLAKRENEGGAYAVENYPARFIDDPRLTALDDEDACDHAAKFEDLVEDMDGDEHERLYNLALNHERSA